jgi:hypothetical protein
MTTFTESPGGEYLPLGRDVSHSEVASVKESVGCRWLLT